MGAVLALALDADPKQPWSWKPQDFGHGLAHDAKPGKAVIANYRTALERLKIRAPALPEDLLVRWDDFIEEFPDYWLQKKKTKFGSAGLRFIDTLKAIIKDLGEHCLENPGSKPKPRGKGGDPNVFAAWVRGYLAEMDGDGTKKLKL